MNRTSEFKLRGIWQIAKAEYIRFVTDPRIIMVAMLMLVMANLVIQPLMEHADKYGAPINALEPFIAVANSGIFSMFIPAVFIILASDYPDIGPKTLFFIQRIGRVRWLLGEILSIVMVIVSYLASLLVFCSIYTIRNNFFGSDWSDSVTKYISKFPDEANDAISEYLSSRLYNQMNLKDAFFHVVCFMIMYLLMLSLILMLFRVLNLKAAGIFACFVIVAAGVLTASMDLQIMWYFPMANTIVWLHYTDIMREPIVPLSQSYLYFAVCLAVLFLINLIVMKKRNVNPTEE